MIVVHRTQRFDSIANLSPKELSNVKGWIVNNMHCAVRTYVIYLFNRTYEKGGYYGHLGFFIQKQYL